jgi:hypothetical protein
MKSDNKKVLDSFIMYCKAHPAERFWQALRNWSRFSYIAGNMTHEGFGEDTFYFSGKDK